MRGILIAVAICCCILQWHSAAGNDEHAEVCRLFKTGTILRKPGTCDQYIECESDMGRVYSCPSEQKFDVAKQSCSVSSTQSTGTCDTWCADPTHNGKWVSDPTNCHGFFYCSNGEAHQGYCPHGYHFDQQFQMCVHDRTSSCIGFNGLCSVVAEGTKYRDETDCAYYYECVKGVQKRLPCKDKFYFDVTTQSCVAKETVECTAHSRVSCLEKNKIIKGPVNDGVTCRGYFECRDLDLVEDLEPVWRQCPENTFFDATTKSCLEPTEVVCTSNRCEGRGTRLVASSSGDCHKYIECVNDKEVGTFDCNNNMFFNENLQVCVKNLIEYKCCAGQK